MKLPAPQTLVLTFVASVLIVTLVTLASLQAANTQTGAGKVTTAKVTQHPGQALFHIHCAACHQEGAQGQVGFAPSIRNRDFLALADDDYLRQAIREGRPGTAMVGRPDLKDEEVDQIIGYLRSGVPSGLAQVKLRADWKAQGNQKVGQLLFANYCSACHGRFGEGYMANVPGTGIGLPGFLAAASDDYILQTLKRGRIGTPMQPFLGARGLANLSEEDAGHIITHMRHLGETYADRIASQPLRPGNPTAGEVHFNVNCAACHQQGGVGKVGFAPSIRNRDFLAIATDDFIRQTITEGRAGTGMVPRPDLPPQTVADIIAYLRALPMPNLVHIKVDPHLKRRGDATEGAGLFANYCASCHGPNGEGYGIGMPGPAIGLPGFLKVASDDYIFQTLKHGRMGTPMKSFIGSRGLANLSEGQVHDIIAHLRVLETRQPAAAADAGSDFE